MGNTLKTRANNASVKDFIAAAGSETKIADSFALLAMHERATNEKAQMWGTSIIGFGKYHYKSERSAQEGDWPLAAFSPRKQNLTIYIMGGFDNHAELLSKLGKYKTSKGCLYINKLTDVDVTVLEQLIKKSYLDAKKRLT